MIEEIFTDYTAFEIEILKHLSGKGDTDLVVDALKVFAETCEKWCCDTDTAQIIAQNEQEKRTKAFYEECQEWAKLFRNP